jgi:hypothetical protein
LSWQLSPAKVFVFNGSLLENSFAYVSGLLVVPEFKENLSKKPTI